MAPVIPNPAKIKSFRTEAAFAAWLKANHARETEIWLKIHKKGSGLPTVTNAQAIDVAADERERRAGVGGAPGKIEGPRERDGGRGDGRAPVLHGQRRVERHVAPIETADASDDVQTPRKGPVGARLELLC